jgi:hypothetical protein
MNGNQTARIMMPSTDWAIFARGNLITPELTDTTVRV